jgi:cyanophycin synthetase
VRFQVENVLAATAAAWSLNVPLEAIREGLRTFRNSHHEAPARFNVLVEGEAAIIVDYAHNPSAASAMAAALDAFPQPRRTLVFSGCNRRDIDLIDMGKAAGDAFDRVILYPDWGRSDRRDGELNALLVEGLRLGKRVAQVEESEGERAALEVALGSLKAGEVLVLGVETIEESLAFVEDWIKSQTRPVWNPSP